MSSPPAIVYAKPRGHLLVLDARGWRSMACLIARSGPLELVDVWRCTKCGNQYEGPVNGAAPRVEKPCEKSRT